MIVSWLVLSAVTAPLGQWMQHCTAAETSATLVGRCLAYHAPGSCLHVLIRPRGCCVSAEQQLTPVHMVWLTGVANWLVTI